MMSACNFPIVVALFLLSSFANAQEVKIRASNVSPAIRSYVDAHCSQAKHLRYFEEKENGQRYVEVEFVEDHREYFLKFLGDVLIETEVEIAFDDLPLANKQKIEQKLKELFVTYRVIECQQVTAESNPQIEIEVKDSKDHYYELMFDSFGSLTKQTEINVKPISSQF
jgi:hypothetical protein